MSVSRGDLLELVRVQDKMANGVKEVSGISLGRQLAFPAAMTSEVADFIDVVVQVSRVVVKIIGATRELSRSAFGTRQTNVILDFVSQVEADERRSDEMQAGLRARLKQHEAELSAVDAIFLYQLLSAIGDIANNAEKVAHRAQIIATS